MEHNKIWKKIPGYSLYEASTDGEIKTYNWKNTGKEAIMKPALDACGYLRTMLKSDKWEMNTVKVHRIIAQTFLENPENKPCVNHINGIRNDNRLCNLEWCTHSENSKHSFKIGLSSLVGERNPAATITEDKVIEIRQNYPKDRKHGRDGYPTKQELADKYGVSINVIKFIIQGKTWKHLL